MLREAGLREGLRAGLCGLFALELDASAGAYDMPPSMLDDALPEDMPPPVTWVA